jgi:hypothetical protein
MTMKIAVRDYFGGCPKCGRQDGLYNVSKQHWFVCHTHKVRWTVGSNILSNWCDETEDDQRERWQVVADYEDIRDGALPVGTWAKDPEIRRHELEEARQKKRDEEAREERRGERYEKVVALLVGALTPVAADILSGEEISILVRPNTEIHLTAAGVEQKEVLDECPF